MPAQRGPTGLLPRLLRRMLVRRIFLRTSSRNKKEKGGSRSAASSMSRITLIDARVTLLTDVTSAVFAYERRSGRTGNAAVVAAIVIGVRVIGVRIAAERRGCDCTGRTDRAADHARGYL